MDSAHRVQFELVFVVLKEKMEGGFKSQNQLFDISKSCLYTSFVK